MLPEKAGDHPDTLGGLVDFLRRLAYARQLRGLAVCYLDASGNPHTLLAAAQADPAAAVSMAKGLRHLGEMLAAHALPDV